MIALPALDVVSAGTIGLVALAAAALGLLVATVAVHVAADRSEARRVARWARWERALLDVLVGEAPPSSLDALVGDGERGDFFQLLIAYALRLGGESRAVLSEAAAPHLGTARLWLSDRRADRRGLAAHLFGLVGSPPDLRRLVPLLHDPSPEVGMIAARALGRSGDLAYLRPVVGALDRFDAWGTPAVASALTLFGVEAGPGLQDGLADPALGESARSVCAEALRRLGYVPAGDVAASLLLSDEAPPLEVQAAALRLLRDVGGPGHAAAARAHIDHDDEVVRLHAVSALSALSLQPDDAARIELALGDASPWVALRAARGLIESGRTAPLRSLAAGDSASSGVARQALAEAGLLVPAP